MKTTRVALSVSSRSRGARHSIYPRILPLLAVLLSITGCVSDLIVTTDLGPDDKYVRCVLDGSPWLAVGFGTSPGPAIRSTYTPRGFSILAMTGGHSSGIGGIRVLLDTPLVVGKQRFLEFEAIDTHGCSSCGTVTVSEVDTLKRLVRGSFEADPEGADGGRLEIRNGQFTVGF